MSTLPLTGQVMTQLASSADDALAKRFARGEARAFEQVVAVHRGRIARLAHRLLGWPADVDDVVQEVFLSAYRHHRRFSGRSSLATWLTSITLNQCRAHRRRRMAVWLLLRRFSSGRDMTRAFISEDSVQRDETSQVVRRAVQRLAHRDREVIVLHYLEELEVREIAELLGKARNTIEVRLHRARLRLKALLSNLIPEEP